MNPCTLLCIAERVRRSSQQRLHQGREPTALTYPEQDPTCYLTDGFLSPDCCYPARLYSEAVHVLVHRSLIPFSGFGRHVIASCATTGNRLPPCWNRTASISSAEHSSRRRTSRKEFRS